MRKPNNCGKQLFKHDKVLINSLQAPPFCTSPILAGADEVGRGALAGPVVAAVVCFPQLATLCRKNKPETKDKKRKFKKSPISQTKTSNNFFTNTLNTGIAPWVYEIYDSKKINTTRRRHLAHKLRQSLPAYAIASASPAEIDRMNIVNASRLAVLRAVYLLSTTGNMPTTIILDALTINSLNFHVQTLTGKKHNIQQLSFKKADEKSWVVAAASILAKETRDAWMKNLDGIRFRKNDSKILEEESPYHFANNKGYGTAVHRLAIKKTGIGKWHRRSFTNHLLS